MIILWGFESWLFGIGGRKGGEGRGERRDGGSFASVDCSFWLLFFFLSLCGWNAFIKGC